MSHLDLYARVTAQIIAALEAGTPPWVAPWRSGGSGLPSNLSTGRPYRGVNVLLLQMQARIQGYSHPRWLTFQQARALGACVRRGETGTPIVFFKVLEVDESPGAARMGAANDAPARKVVPLLRSFTVFNADQVDGLPEALMPATAMPTDGSPEWRPNAQAQALLDRSGAVIRHGGDQAFYSPSQDLIQLPPPDRFRDAQQYHRVALHELTHWTGHPDRCNRTLASRAHLEAYAFEELVAELGSAFLCSHCGLQGELYHASYIDQWLNALRRDTRLIFSAASLAQKAADYLVPPVVHTPLAPTSEVGEPPRHRVAGGFGGFEVVS